MEAVQKQSAIQTQRNIIQTAEEVKNTLNDLYNWQKEVKDKEQKLNTEKDQAHIKSQPIRSHIAKKEQSETITNGNAENNRDYEEKDEEQNRIKDADMYKELGNANVKNGLYEKAVLDYTRALDSYDGDPKYYTNRAFCYLKLERYNECIDDCTKAIELDKLNEKAYYRRMQANEFLGFNTQALKDCTTVLMIEPKNSAAKASLQRINQRLKKTGAVPKGYHVTDTCTPKEGPRFSPLQSNMVDILPATKLANTRSKKQLKTIPIMDVIGSKDGKNFENSNIQISDEVIDKLFNGECGSFEEVKKSDKDKKVKNLENESSGVVQEKTVTKPTKVTKLEAQLASAKKNRPLPPAPTSTAQFYCNWKELTAEQKYLYLKSIQVNQLNKILGAGFDSETLTDLLMVFRESYIQNKDELCPTLMEVSKHDRLKILSLMLSAEDESALLDALNYIETTNPNTNDLNAIRKSFNLE